MGANADILWGWVMFEVVTSVHPVGQFPHVLASTITRLRLHMGGVATLHHFQIGGGSAVGSLDGLSGCVQMLVVEV